MIEKPSTARPKLARPAPFVLVGAGAEDAELASEVVAVALGLAADDDGLLDDLLDDLLDAVAAVLVVVVPLWTAMVLLLKADLLMWWETGAVVRITLVGIPGEVPVEVQAKVHVEVPGLLH